MSKTGTRPDPRLGDWLRAIRTSLTPQQFGITPSSRRRESCLTQVELARLAGLTPRAYQGVEQGHRNPGPRLLAGIVTALGLSPTQIQHLRRLAQPAEPAESPTLTQAELKLLVHCYPTPAVAYDQTWQALEHNAAFKTALPIAAVTPNLLHWFFTTAEARHLFIDWHKEAAELIARLRTIHGHYRDTHAFDTLIRDLCDASSVARELWGAGVEVADEPARKTCRLRFPGRPITKWTILQLQPSGVNASSVRVAVCLPNRRVRGNTRPAPESQ